MCLVVYGLKRLKQRGAKKVTLIDEDNSVDVIGPAGLKTSINPFILLIPSTFDLASSILSFFALIEVSASVYQMVRGVIILITALLAFIFLG